MLICIGCAFEYIGWQVQAVRKYRETCDAQADTLGHCYFKQKRTDDGHMPPQGGRGWVVTEVMVRRDGKQAEISPYDWIYVKDGLPLIDDSSSSRRACYVCFNDGKTCKAFYTGSIMDTWLSQDDTHIALNENEIVAWRYQAPA